MSLPGPTGRSRRSWWSAPAPAGWRPPASPPSAAISVTVLEAAEPGRRAGPAGRAEPAPQELIGIVDWRLSELERLGVEIRYDIWAEQDDVLALAPDVVDRRDRRAAAEPAARRAAAIW